MELFSDIFASNLTPKFDNLLENLTDEQVNLLGVFLEKRGCLAGEKIAVAGDENHALFIIIEGRVILSGKSSPGATANCGTTELDAGDIFGEIAFFSQENSCISAEALDDCKLFMLTHQQFKRMAERYPALGYELCHAVCLIIASRLSRACKKISGLT